MSILVVKFARDCLDEQRSTTADIKSSGVDSLLPIDTFVV